MEEIGKLLPAVLQMRAKRAETHLAEFLAPLWPRIAGKQLARHCRPAAFSAGTLTLTATCPSWATQLRHLTEEIRAEINSYLGAPVIKKLRIRYVPEPSSPVLPTRQQSSPGAPAISVGLPPHAAAQLDSEMAQILERSFAKYFARKQRVH